MAHVVESRRMSAGQVAKALGVTREAVRRMRVRGLLKGSPLPQAGSNLPAYEYDPVEVSRLKRSRAAKRGHKSRKEL